MFNQSNWDEVRKKGMFRFVLVNGVLSFGLPVAIASAFVRFYFGNPGTDSWSEYLFAGGTWLGYLLQAIVSGIVFGLVVWFLNSRNAEKAEQSRDSSDEE
jgi:dolichyl-phosphate-mannose--protein O-mannosyl transferase